MKNYGRRVIDFAIGDSVVLHKERKVGRVTKVTTLCVDVLLDGEQNSKKSVQKKKIAVMRIYILSSSSSSTCSSSDSSSITLFLKNIIFF